MTESALDYSKRLIRYNATDGIDEMFVGFLFLLLPSLTHIANVAPEGSVWRWKPSLLIADALLLVFLFLARKLLKERITYQRTGYVKFRYSKLRGVIGSVIGFVVAGGILIYVSRVSPAEHRDLVLLGLGSALWAGFYLYFLVFRAGLHRIYRYAVAILLAVGPIAVYTIFSHVRDISTLSSTVPGGCFLLSGIITFWLYLHNTKPRQTQSTNEAQ